jgi:hypothetical protein
MLAVSDLTQSSFLHFNTIIASLQQKVEKDACNSLRLASLLFLLFAEELSWDVMMEICIKIR